MYVVYSSSVYVAVLTHVRYFQTLQNELHGLSVGDSLLECANIHLTDYQKLMNIKNSLEKQLETSNERLKSTHEENRKIIEILNSKLDSNTSKDFYNKIQKLITAGKLTKNEENEMLQVHQKIENILQVHDALQAANNYLKRLIEKLSYRITMEHIKTEKETSTDINYLQEQLNSLRKECVMLRAMEEDYYKAIQQTRKPAIISDRDAENINAIIRERNSLREKCKSLKGLEKVVVELQNKAKESDSTNSALNSNLNDQSSYIKNLECKMEKMAKYYKEQLQQACSTEQCLKVSILIYQFKKKT